MAEDKEYRVQIRPACEDEWEDAMALAWRTFMKFEACDYSEEGISSFSDFISDNTLKKMFKLGHYRLFIALIDQRIVGLISIRDENHISLLFVDEKYHHQGIGSSLIQYVLRYLKAGNCEQCCTVNSSPYAVGFYRTLGFQDVAKEQVSEGIRYTPMTISI